MSEDIVPKICSIEDCNRKHYGKGWCVKHYKRWWRYGDPLSVKLIRGSIEKSFFAKFERVTESGCWIWTAGLHKQRYGAIWNKDAHRVSWEIHHGEIPDGLHVCHRCDVPSCVNPNHLFLGTHQDNMDDMVKKGRQRTPNGESHARSKITENDVREMRVASDAGVSRAKLASKYGLHCAHVGLIVRRKSWEHVA